MGATFTLGLITYTKRDRAGLLALTAGGDVANLAKSCTTGVTDMSSLFAGLTQRTLNPDIISWDTSSVTTMYDTFIGTTNFNRDISYWNTGAVTTMFQMFASATAFNQDISTWNTGEVTDMRYMFLYAAAFNNGDTGNTGANPLNWADTSKVTNMNNMFQNAAAFNQDISTWNTGAVTNMNAMFGAATAFNQDISAWTASPSTCGSFATGATAWIAAYPGGINANPPLSPSMVAAGCGL